MSTREYSVSEPAVMAARANGLYGNTAARIRRMARRSAPVTSKYGNRRFHDWVLRIAGSEVQDVTRVFDR